MYKIFHLQVPYPIIIPVKKQHYHHPQPYHHDLRHHDLRQHDLRHHDLRHHLDSHHHLTTYDHHTDFTNNKYQQVSAHRPQSSEQSSSSASSSSSGEFQEFIPRPEHLREAPASSQHEQTKLFSPSQSETPYNQQHQLHHQQQYAQLRRDLLTRERMRSSSDESEAESTEFRPIIHDDDSGEYMSPSSNVETVVPPPPNQQTRSSFHINVPNENEPVKEVTSNSGQSNNQFTHNIEIPVHFYRLQPLENGEGFAITS